MDKPIEELQTVKFISHKFYCDDCGTYLGESDEYEDGWYEEL